MAIQVVDRGMRFFFFFPLHSVYIYSTLRKMLFYVFILIAIRKFVTTTPECVIL